MHRYLPISLLVTVATILIITLLQIKVIARSGYQSPVQTQSAIVENTTPPSRSSSAVLSVSDEISTRVLAEKQNSTLQILQGLKLLGAEAKGATGINILTYHYVRIVEDKNDAMGLELSVTPDNFARQMEYIYQQGYHTLDVPAVASLDKLPHHSILLTFDDGYRDFYTTVFPILKQYNLHVELFVITEFVGREDFMTWDMLKELRDSGLVTIGAHTLTHPHLTRIHGAELRAEIRASKAILQQKLNIPITDFSYPFGNHNSEVEEEVKLAGYSNALTTKFGAWTADSDPFTISRNEVTGFMQMDYFTNMLPK